MKFDLYDGLCFFFTSIDKTSLWRQNLISYTFAKIMRKKVNFSRWFFSSKKWLIFRAHLRSRYACGRWDHRSFSRVWPAGPEDFEILRSWIHTLNPLRWLRLPKPTLPTTHDLKKNFSLANARHQYIDIPYLFQPMSKILVLPPPPPHRPPPPNTHTHSLIF